MPRNREVLAVTLACLLLGFAGTASAENLLPLGRLVSGRLTGESPAEYRIKADGAGILTVAVHGDSDLYLSVSDADGQPLRDGRADRDLHGDAGLEMLSLILTEAGEYRVQVLMFGGGGTCNFQIAGSWLPFAAFSRPGDPDGRPGRARALNVGEAIEDGLNGPEGDLVDWFSITPTSAGTMVVVTRPVNDSEGDLVLEAFLDGNFSNPVANSDQDLQGVLAAESVSVNVRAGQTVHIRVSSPFDGVIAAYRLSSTMLP